MHPEWHNNNNSAFKNKLSLLQFIVTTVSTLAYFTMNADVLILDVLEEIIPKTKHPIFGIEQFIKNIIKVGKLNDIVLSKITQKDIVTD